jgi:FAD:protein FMN transferase
VSKDIILTDKGTHFCGVFRAMNSPCEILLEAPNENLASQWLKFAVTEVWRIEQKFSRYLLDNYLYQINHSDGKPFYVDVETAKLLDFAEHCYRMSEGLFDVSSGILRKVWCFDGSDHIPDQVSIAPLLPRIGWHKISWHNPRIILPMGMEIDLGGVAKEYAADRVALLLQSVAPKYGCLVNLGGDIALGGVRCNDDCWRIGIESPDGRETEELSLSAGGLATSGDVHRYLLKDGKRYSHILDPRTGWPIEQVPRSVTVMANSCTEAGLLATLSLLCGREAENFLDQQDVRYWCLR